MKTVELILAALGAGITIFVTVTVAASAAADRSAAAILAAVAVVGFAGFIAVSLDDKGRSHRWGAMTWLVAGVLTAMVYLAGFSFGLFLIPAVLAFVGAAILADRRRGRSSLRQLGVYLGGALACALVVVLVNLLDWV